jgi:CubicO group peptidase (beta-lactamase class C family)
VSAAPAPLPAVLARAVDARVTPGAVVEAGYRHGAVWTVAAGRHTYAADAPPVSLDTVYDLASLTKVVATTTLAAIAHARGALPFETRVGERIPAFATHPAITVGDLLEHAAGFPAHRPYYLSIAGRAAYRARLAEEPLAYLPRARHEYTDLGFMLLAMLLEMAEGAPLDVQFDRLVAAALPGAEIAFGIRDAWHARTAPSGVCPWRGRVMAGHVHDANAAALDGIAGHAGLFATAPAVGTFARWWLRLWQRETTVDAGIPSALVARMTEPGRVPASSRALGWDTMLPTSSCGTRLSKRAIGHTGFTGTSLWIDPERDLYVVLLTNRVHASDDLDGIRRLRIAVHDAVAGAWDART